MEKIKVYIAGKVTGEDYQQCYDKFQALHDTLTGFGYQVINPMHIVPFGTPWMDAMAILKPHLINSDVVLFLPDWVSSQGSIEERVMATFHNISIVDYEHMDRFIKKTCSA